jgi:uncharacterized protein with HEPN domain
MRDNLIHRYNNIDLEEVWKISHKDIPALLSALEPIFEDIPALLSALEPIFADE